MRKLAYLFVCLLALPAAGQPWSGSGTPNDPYQIWDACDMQAIGANSVYLDAHFVLCADINLAEYTGTSFNMIGGFPYDPFAGVFDGNGHTISNFTYETVGGTVGLFRNVEGANAEIKDLTLINPNLVLGPNPVGCLVGYLHTGTISDCSVVGGRISGVNGAGAGGLAGEVNFRGHLTNCCVIDTVVVGSPPYRMVGGLVGYLVAGSISDCYARANVSGSWVGGLVGATESGAISNCYAASMVNGSCSGGLVGHDESCVYTKCFWDNTINQSLEGIGNGNDPNVIGKTTAEMQDANTYIDAGWDFNTPIWKMCNVPDYPSLWWEECPVLEPDELIDELLEEIAWLELPGGIENSLMAKLNSALAALEDENENNDVAAINTLEAFINAVEAQRGKKIPAAEADDLIAASQQIIELLSD